jgi:hypothetical protein
MHLDAKRHFTMKFANKLECLSFQVLHSGVLQRCHDISDLVLKVYLPIKNIVY